jgi:hypothetical protein
MNKLLLHVSDIKLKLHTVALFIIVITKFHMPVLTVH